MNLWIKWDLAINAYKNALTLDPKYPEALIGMGDSLMWRGKLDEALKLFEEASAVAPDMSQPYSHAGRVYFQKAC